MKTLKLSFSLIIFLLLGACSVDYTFEIDPITHDTINFRDANGRQGRWIVENGCSYNLPPSLKIADSTKAIQFSAITLTNYIIPSVIEIGNYVNNKKQGIWIFYDPSGAIIKTEEFKDDLSTHNSTVTLPIPNYLTGVNKIKDQQFVITNGIYASTKININVQNPNDTFADIKIVNVFGHPIYETKNWPIIEKEINIKDLECGTYFIFTKTKATEQIGKLIVLLQQKN